MHPVPWLLAASLVAGPAAARTLQVGPGQPYTTLGAAAAAAQDGDLVSIAAGAFFDCAVWFANNLTIAGAGMASTVIGNKSCAGKGVFVIYGNNVTVRDLTLRNAAVPDGNGAGIRVGGANLTIERVRLLHNEDGVFADPLAGSTLLVSDSQFDADGACSGAECGHNHALYVQEITQVIVQNSIFFGTIAGHSIKSRAAITTVTHDTIEDGPNGTSSYLIEAPNGGALTVSNCRLEKGPNSINWSIAISMGEEGVVWANNSIRIEDNVMRNDNAHPTTFVFNDTTASAQLIGNTLEGQVTPLVGPGTVSP